MFKPYLEILPVAQKVLWPELREVPRHFVLYGGTALALRLGYRESLDFDLTAEQQDQLRRLASVQHPVLPELRRVSDSISP